MNCTHTETKDVATRAFRGSVSRDENPAAHGGVCVDVECTGCGAHRSENRNAGHIEVSPWGATREERRTEARRAAERVLEILEHRPKSCTVSCDGTTVRVAIDEDGTLVLRAERGDFKASDEVAIIKASGLLPYARGLREAVLTAEGLRAAI